MQEQSDLERVKRVARTMLMTPIHQTKFSPRLSNTRSPRPALSASCKAIHDILYKGKNVSKVILTLK